MSAKALVVEPISD